MLRHYVTIAFRSLRRQWSYALINVGGLAVALAAAIVIGLFVWHEASYDRFAPNANRVYRVVQTVHDDIIAATPPGLAQALQDASPDVEVATVVNGLADETLFERNEKTFFVERVFRADDDFFEVFPYAFKQGNPQTALAQPNTVVVTESLARRLFGDADPIGQVLRYEARADLTVTGVMDDPPTNAHFRPQALVSLSETQRAARYGSSVNWNRFDGVIYLTLRDGSDPAALNRTFDALLQDAEVYGHPHVRARKAHLHPPPHESKRRPRAAERRALPVPLRRHRPAHSGDGVRQLRQPRHGAGGDAGARGGRAQSRRRGAAAGTRADSWARRSSCVRSRCRWAWRWRPSRCPFVNDLAGLELGIGALFQPVALAALLGLVLGVGCDFGGVPGIRAGPLPARAGAARQRRGRVAQRVADRAGDLPVRGGARAAHRHDGRAACN